MVEGEKKEYTRKTEDTRPLRVGLKQINVHLSWVEKESSCSQAMGNLAAHWRLNRALDGLQSQDGTAALLKMCFPTFLLTSCFLHPYSGEL